ncbi:class I SAM-dependent methyltransferase [Geomonas edaphica]|uniref:class I SAM-dependent methyltransferase n=1 Tax=Geomonas edaphica TaxID=2570226 RepID=UPI0013A5F24D|nr:class I SAM-dependent methyltransferase [Geomonas edaphica]
MEKTSPPETFSIMNVDDFAKLFGTSSSEVLECCSEELASLDPHYRVLAGDERDQVLLQVLAKIDDPGTPESGTSRLPDWERGWGENLDEFVRSGYDIEKLVPKYFKKNVPARFMGEYILPIDPQFVLVCTRMFRRWIFGRYLAPYDTIYEFGCGPATHLAFLAQNYPGKKLVGLDWARPSQEIISLLAQHRGWDIEGRHFDFFHPDPTLRLAPRSAVYTFGALEQVGGRHGEFLDFLLREKPAICVNVECLCEYYDASRLSDYLALRYHRRKKYLDGYLTRLKELEARGRIEILASHHQRFGNMYDDSNSYVVWRPL